LYDKHITNCKCISEKGEALCIRTEDYFSSIYKDNYSKKIIDINSSLKLQNLANIINYRLFKNMNYLQTSKAEEITKRKTTYKMSNEKKDLLRNEINSSNTRFLKVKKDSLKTHDKFRNINRKFYLKRMNHLLSSINKFENLNNTSKERRLFDQQNFKKISSVIRSPSKDDHFDKKILKSS